MSDFYSVLKQSILERGLSSYAAREDVYAQARRALIQRLWSYDPPLAETEIDGRIGQFDGAVDQIESDLVTAFAESIATESGAGGDAAREPVAASEPGPPPPVYEGYDEEADYAPTFGGSEGLRDREAAAGGGRTAARSQAAEAMPRRVASLLERVEAAPTYFAGQSKARPAPADRPPPAAIEVAYPPEPADEFIDRADAEELVEDAPPAAPTARPARRAFGYGVEESLDERPVAEDAEDDRGGFSDEATAAPAARKARAKRRSERDTVRILVTVIATLAVVLVGFSAYLLYPHFFAPGGANRVATTTDGPKIVGRLVGDPKTAVDVPKRALTVAQTYVIFDGRDPTVFEGTSANPIQFDKDALGGFARISSASGAAGAKAMIGAGLAAELAGKNIRVTIVARAGRENGAGSLRFAYQTGLAISFWQEANLGADYTTLGMIWRVPALRTNPSGDFLVIEPGIPGDGTAVEIQSIKIEALMS